MIGEHWMPTRLPGSWQQVMRRRAPLARAIALWLPERRWFAGKAAVIERVVIENVRPLASDNVDVALLIVAVTFDDGQRHRYNVPVVRQPFGYCVPAGVIAFLDDGMLYDAMLTGDGCRAVVEAALGRRVTVRVRPVGVEQSNSSVIVGRSLIAKLIRRLEPGSNPDAEIPELLHRNGFVHAPRVAGTLRVDLSDGTAEAVIVHQLIPNHGDLWAWMLTALEEQRLADTTRIARLLGKRTAEMHQALAAAGCTTATVAWQRRLLANVKRELTRTSGAWHQASASATGSDLDDRDAWCQAPDVLARFERLGRELIDVPLMRVHGDLHLGQVLATRDGDVAIIDFEGEPARTLGERRALQSPLVDLAGLLRSIDYAARTAVADGHLSERARVSWTRRTTEALTTAYFRHAAGTTPPNANDTALLLDLFVLQKALYEVRYELANRPDWVRYPLAAVTELV